MGPQIALLGIRLEAISFHHNVRVWHRLPLNTFKTPMRFFHAVVPFSLSTSGKIDDPEISFQISPDSIGDKQAA